MATTYNTTADEIQAGDVTREYGRIVKITRVMDGGIQVRYVQGGRRRQVTLTAIRKLTKIN